MWRPLLGLVVLLVAPLVAQDQTTTTEAPTRRRVTIPPLIVEEPPLDIAFREGESFEMPCVATGEPKPLYKWKMNDKDFDPSGNDGRIAIQPGVGTLIFANPIERDEALYQCLGSNQVGTALTIKVNLRVAYLDEFTNKAVRTNNPQLGDDLKLKCTRPRSFPPADVFWALVQDGERFTPLDLDDRVTMDPEGNLYFLNIAAEDEKDGRQYACIVQNKVMRMIQQGEYNIVRPTGQFVYKEPSVLWISPTHQVALRGHTLRIKCIFSGNPTPQVDWHRIDKELPSRTREESYGQELVIENVQLEDVGKYECQGINNQSPTPIRRSFDLAVEAAPYWTTMPQSIDGAEGDKAEFSCKAEGIPEPVNFWFINGIPDTKLPDDPRRVREPNKMTFYNLTKADAQVIQCNSTNKHGYIFANAYLNVLTEPPLILDAPIEGQKAAEGQTINLTCVVFGSPKPLVVWHKGSEQLTGGRFKVMDNGNLEITDTMLVDAGMYTCTATNSLDTTSASGSLIVRRATTIQTPPQDVMVYDGTEAKFTCTGTTDPEEVKNLKIDWKKDGQLIDYELAQRIFKNDMDNSLTLSGAMSLDTGKYTCVASNGLDESEASAQLVVQAVPDPPNNVWMLCVNEQQQAEIYWQPGRENYAPILNFVLQFNTTFSPDTWYTIESNVSQTKRSMKVILSPYGNYTFRVLARNKIGISQPSHHTPEVCTTQPGRPTKNPENVMGEGDLPNNLVIFWTPMPPIEQNGAEFKYIVSWVRLDIPSDVMSYPLANPNDWFYVVPEEVPTYKPFKVKVKANNRVGDCVVEPEWVIGYSGEGEPKAAPSNVAVVDTSIGSTDATLTWDAVDMSPEVIQGFFRGYRVQFSKIEDWPDNIREHDYIFNESYRYPRPRIKRAVNQVVVQMENLPPYSTIRLQVRVLNKYYAGPPSQFIEFQTTEGQPGPPAMFDVTVRGPTHLELVWLPPYQPNGELVGYSISYQSITGLNFGRIKYREPIRDPNANSAKLTGLLPDTYFRVFIAAATVRGVGEQIFLDMKTAPPGPPAPPTFAIEGLNETWANITWEPSTGDNPGSIFYVEYRERSAYPWQRLPDEYIVQWAELKELEQGTIYQVRVVAKNGDDTEAPSEWLELRTYGNPVYNFYLATAVWFYGIWIALFLIIALVILFFFAKQRTDAIFLQKNDEIHETLRQMQAEEAAKQLGIMEDFDEMGGSRQFLNTSGDYEDDDGRSYNDDDMDDAFFKDDQQTQDYHPMEKKPPLPSSDIDYGVENSSAAHYGYDSHPSHQSMDRAYPSNHSLGQPMNQGYPSNHSLGQPMNLAYPSNHSLSQPMARAYPSNPSIGRSQHSLHSQHSIQQPPERTYVFGEGGGAGRDGLI